MQVNFSKITIPVLQHLFSGKEISAKLQIQLPEYAIRLRACIRKGI